MGTVYLLHLHPAYKHARHYVGYVAGDDLEAVEARLDLHRTGRGARLLEVAVAAGCVPVLARTWTDRTRGDERALKARRCTPRYCPICRSAARVARLARLADAISS